MWCDVTPGCDTGASSQLFHFLGILIKDWARDIGFAQMQAEVWSQSFRIPLPHFFFSKKINILLFLWILVFSHSSSSVFYDDPGWGRRALLLQWRRELTLVAPYPPINNLRALAGPEALRRDEGTSHDFLGGPETAPLSFRFVSKPPILVLILSLRRRGSLATSSFSPLQHWIVRSVRLLGKRSPFTLAMMTFGDAKAKESPRAVLENVNCGFGRVYFSILYEENVLFPKTEVIFLTNRCHK